MVHHYLKKRKDLLNRGQSVLEYIMLTGLIGVFSLFAVQKFGQQIERKFEAASERVNKTIKIR
ncbi:MAG: hypothetical protein H6621_01895 [Halobacteriovoraceae bacterium]|nr:hypothetical protein [Halobacteriovoraceae bacterium]MCB9093794.1 hypothetical protein [Halobacteriovoraceae bacterium]